MFLLILTIRENSNHEAAPKPSKLSDLKPWGNSGFGALEIPFRGWENVVRRRADVKIRRDFAVRRTDNTRIRTENIVRRTDFVVRRSDFYVR